MCINIPGGRFCPPPSDLPPSGVVRRDEERLFAPEPMRGPSRLFVGHPDGGMEEIGRAENVFITAVKPNPDFHFDRNAPFGFDVETSVPYGVTAVDNNLENTMTPTIDLSTPPPVERVVPPLPPIKTVNGETKGTIYISGPMSGFVDNNRAAFYEAEAALRAMGYDTVNPAREDEEQGMLDVWHDFLARDVALFESRGVTAVALIDGWRNSRGGTLEAYFAQQTGRKIFELVGHGEFTPGVPGSRIWSLDPVEDISAAYTAQNIVLGARRYDYGHPLDNFMRIAGLFNAYLSHKLEEPLDVRDVAMLMILVKMGREQNAPKKDNRIDIIGYALALDEAINEMSRRGGNPDTLLSGNALLLREHSVLGAATVARPE